MARTPDTKPSGAYALLDMYGVLAVPIEALPLLTGVLRLDQEYNNDRKVYDYKLRKDQRVEFKLMPAEEMTAIRVASKLEGAP